MLLLNVPYLPQNFEFDCWYASLRMLVKYRHGPHVEPIGHPTAELEGMMRDSARSFIKENAIRNGLHPASYGIRKQLSAIAPRGLKQAEFTELAAYNGLVAPMLPTPYQSQTQTGGFSVWQLESLMRVHGPLWCAFGYGHIVVAKGIDMHDNVMVHDPQGQADELYPIQNFNSLLTWQPNCVMFLRHGHIRQPNLVLRLRGG